MQIHYVFALNECKFLNLARLTRKNKESGKAAAAAGG